MRNLATILLFLLVACDEESRDPKPLALYTRSSACVTVEQAAPWAVKLRASGLPHVVAEIRYASGAGEVWVTQQGGVIPLVRAPQWAVVYPAWVHGFEGYPVTIKENGDGSLQTTSGRAVHEGRIILWHGGANGSWTVEYGT